MRELKTIDEYLAGREYGMASMLTMAGFFQFRGDWREWMPNPVSSRTVNLASDMNVAREYASAAYLALDIFFRIGMETGEMRWAHQCLDDFGSDLRLSRRNVRAEIIDKGIGDVAEDFLRFYRDERIRKFAIEGHLQDCYRDVSHFHNAIQLAHGTPLQSRVESLALEIVDKIPQKPYWDPLTTSEEDLVLAEILKRIPIKEMVELKL